MTQKILLNRFLEYVKINTQSDPYSTTVPSSNNQFDLANYLEKEIECIISKSNKEISSYVDKHGFVYVKITGNSNYSSVGFLAHMDTAPDYSGTNVNPKVINNYDGKVITLNDTAVLNPIEFPSLLNYIGQTIITTDGTTLLGADNKAGIAIIMNLLDEYSNDNVTDHPTIFICFTVDEEVGSGINSIDLNFFNPDFAYTVDGGPLGEYNYETFNAASLVTTFNGVNIHPGAAKDKMINAQELAIKFHNMLPHNDKPELTKEREGFFMLFNSSGNVAKTTFEYIIRDHNKEIFEYRKNYAIKCLNQLKLDNPRATVEYELSDTYYNMYQEVMEKPFINDIAIQAIKDNNINPIIVPVRGGTDGSKLSFKGIPCPNLFTGGHNFHGKYEYCCLETMFKSYQVCSTIVKLTKNI